MAGQGLFMHQGASQSHEASPGSSSSFLSAPQQRVRTTEKSMLAFTPG